MAAQTLFIFGLGYVGQHLGRHLLTQGWRVEGTTRTQAQAENLKQQGFEVVVWDGASPFSRDWGEGAHILVTIPPDEKGDVVLRYADFGGARLQWVGYLSATSVYGDHKGAWVTENSALNPVSSRGLQRCLAESQWFGKQAAPPSFPLHIFRLSGIYGPGRSVLEAIRLGTAQRISKPGHVFSRIHVKDIVSTLEASMAHPQPGAIYNLADDEPSAPGDLVAYGCGMLGVDAPPPIPFDQADLSPLLREFYAEEKRVANQKVKDSLGIQLTYPTYREGLLHC